MAEGVDVAIATFGAGCFWGVELAFSQVAGVKETTAGYSGGNLEDPSYEQVCTDRTGHAEVVRVEYDSDVVSYDELLDVFWQAHDPTQLNRQGPDVGTQYRSAIFFHDDEQRVAALRSKARWQALAKRPIVTEIGPAAEFWPAEEYHQRYLAKRGETSCHVVTDWLT